MRIPHNKVLGVSHLEHRLPTDEEIGLPSQQNGFIHPFIPFVETGEASKFLIQTNSPLSSSPVFYNPLHPQIKKFIEKYHGRYSFG